MTALPDLTSAATGSVPASLLAQVPTAQDVLAFVSATSGLVGWGAAERCEADGPDAAVVLQRWFDDLAADLPAAERAELVAFVSLGFAPEDTSVAIVPRALRRAGADPSDGSALPPHPDPTPVEPVTAPGLVRWSDQQHSAVDHRRAVAEAVAEIASGAVDKVVLSHDLTAVTENPVDERFLLQALAGAYPTCWTYAVDHLVGASPEMLVARHGRQVTSRVLAGTGWAEHRTDEVVRALLSSRKDLAEHSFAVDSVAEVFRRLCRSVDVPDRPSPLVLANLVHLATDVTGRLRAPAPTALQVAAALHPTAAVGGHPREAALPIVRRLEGRARGRYAAPVGWVDGNGDGEFALALRGALVDGSTVRLTAGGGVVAASDPDTEVREAQIKMLPVRDALESTPRS